MKTTIEWCDYTFNPWSGCSKVSPGCAHCYAEVNYSVKMRGVKWGPSGNRIVKAESGWKEPIGWDRMAKQAGERRRVFCASLADVFEDWEGPMMSAGKDPIYLGKDYRASSKPEERLAMDDVRARLFRLIDATPNLDWLLLTKRPENIAKMMPLKQLPDAPQGKSPHSGRWTMDRENVWLGVSVEDQKRADERIPLLLQTPAAVRFLSCEPLLGPINLYFGDSEGLPTEEEPCRERHWLLDWVIIGGESGPGARPCNIDWIRDLVRQCTAGSVPVFVKQLGSVPSDSSLYDDELIGLKDKKGGNPSEWPTDLRTREFPK